MDEDKIIYREESYQIVGACFEVYTEKGNGFLEAVYQECLRKNSNCVDWTIRKSRSCRSVTKARFWTNTTNLTFFATGIILEIKAVKQLTDEHRAQIINYLKATGLRLGLLVNFCHYQKIEHERFVR